LVRPWRLTIAKIAHVAKGTMYLHWSTREALLVGLLARDLLAMLDTSANAQRLRPPRRPSEPDSAAADPLVG
jgi:AcrR family transcriptional regulator